MTKILMIYFVLCQLVLISCYELDQNSSDYDTDLDYNEEDNEETEYCSDESLLQIIEYKLLPEDNTDEQQLDYEQANPQQLLAALDHLEEYQANFSRKTEKIMRMFANKYMSNLLLVNISGDCFQTLIRISTAISNGEGWALNFMASTLNFIENLFRLTLPFADYDKCLAIQSPIIENKNIIKGQYCTLDLDNFFEFESKEELFQFINDIQKIESLKNFNISNFFENSQDIFNLLKTPLVKTQINSLGLCLPTICQPKEIALVLNTVLYQFIKIPITFNNDCQYERKSSSLNTIQIITCLILFTSISLVILISILESLNSKYSLINTETEFYKTLIKIFSIKKNASSIFIVRKDDQYKCLDGIKALLSFGVVLGHNFIFTSLNEFGKNNTGFRYVVYINYKAMDNFILMAGIAMFYEYHYKRKTNQLNPIRMIIKRYVKMISIIVVCMLFALFFEKFGDGPLWPWYTEVVTKTCESHWYLPLTMVNNLPYYLTQYFDLPPSFIHCLPQSWFMATYFQLSILSALFFIPLTRNKSKVKIILPTIFVISLFIPLYFYSIKGVTYIDNVTPNNMLNDFEKANTIYYQAVWNYLPSFILGIGLAYLIKNKPDIYLGGHIVENLITIITISMTISEFLWRKHNHGNTGNIDPLYGFGMPIYLVINKVLYLSGFAWVIFICAANRSDFFNGILGWTPLRIVQNLALEIYMFHEFAIQYRIGSSRQQIIFSDYNLWTNTVFDFVLVYVISILASIAFIRPLKHIIELILNRKPSGSNSQLDNTINNNNIKQDNEIKKDQNIDLYVSRS